MEGFRHSCILMLAKYRLVMNERIVIDHSVCSGKAVIRGTRIMVRNILGMVAGGYNTDRIMKACPELSAEDLSAALKYAAAMVDDEQVFSHA